MSIDQGATSTADDAQGASTRIKAMAEELKSLRAVLRTTVRLRKLAKAAGEKETKDEAKVADARLKQIEANIARLDEQLKALRGDARRRQLQAARAVQATKFKPGQTTRTVGAARALAVLRWVYRWGWSTSHILEIVVGSARSGIAQQLVRRGLLVRTRTESGGGVHGVPAAIYTLSSLGLAEVERQSEALLPYDLDPFRVNQALLRHDTIAQTATANAMADGAIQSFETPKELGQKSTAGTKQPDAVWVIDKKETAIEIELSAKWGRDLDEFVRACVLSVIDRQDQPARFAGVSLFSDSAAIVKRYTEAFTPGAQYGIWEKDEQRKWKRTTTRSVPKSTGGKLLCQLIELR